MQIHIILTQTTIQIFSIIKECIQGALTRRGNIFFCSTCQILSFSILFEIFSLAKQIYFFFPILVLILNTNPGIHQGLGQDNLTEFNSCQLAFAYRCSRFFITQVKVFLLLFVNLSAKQFFPFLLSYIEIKPCYSNKEISLYS